MLRIDEPFHGAVLNHRNGTQTEDALLIPVRGRAELSDRVTVNGLPAERAGRAFHSQAVLGDEETDIRAVAEGPRGRQEHVVRVVWDRHSRPRYRFSIDDNIFFLRDIARRRHASLFDCFYLRLLRDLHRRHGTKFALNIYFTDGEDFDLTRFPDRYRGEWRDNSDWLRLAFHAHSNEPDRPYQYARPEELASDLDRVAEQIHRFAGEETYAPPTVIHWGMVQHSAFPVLAERGVRVLSGFFLYGPVGSPTLSGRRGSSWDINYFLDDDRSEYLSRHDALKDFKSGIVFSKVDIVCNKTPVDQTVPILARLAEDPNTAEVMDLFTHEQHFWDFFPRYIPDHGQRLETAIRWATEHGYEPAFFDEGFLWPPRPAAG